VDETRVNFNEDLTSGSSAGQTRKTNRVIRVGTTSDLATAVMGIEIPNEKE
jgi:hypothetical protein